MNLESNISFEERQSAILKKLQTLSPEERKKFNDTVYDYLDDRHICMLNRVRYNNPSSQDVLKIQEVVFSEYYEKIKSD